MKKYFILFSSFFCFSFNSFSQLHAKHKNSSDFGIFLGGSYYNGDLNQTIPFLYTKPAGGIFYRYNFNPRFAFQGHFLAGKIEGHDYHSKSPSQIQRNISFKSPVCELGVQWEFNFFNYRLGIDKEKFSPYVFVGLAGFYFNPMGQLKNGKYVALQPLHTEGEGLPGGSRKKPYPLIQVSIPFGIGLKANLTRRTGFGFEWGLRKTFTDYLDDTHGKYYDISKLDANAIYLSDPSVGTTEGFSNVSRQRGNATTKDWYTFVGATLYIRVGNTKEVCPSVN